MFGKGCTPVSNKLFSGATSIHVDLELNQIAIIPTRATWNCMAN